MTRRGRLVVLSLLMLGWAHGAHARVERFAVIIGNNRGEPHETALRFATADAARLYEVLRDLGGFEPVNMVLLKDEPSATARSTLLAVNERIREATSQPDTDVLLFVYFSGHADAARLHLGGSALEIRELAQLVRGSAAGFRLLVLDACRSGSLTRLKGGRVVEPFELPDARLPSDGLAFLTASSESEDAQESDVLGGSFFTHALVSGLLGAADRNSDGQVALDEAYRYAYDATLRSTSRTLAGTQHPTFRYDFRGSGNLILTRPASYAHTRAHLRFPPGVGFLLLSDTSNGSVAAELSGVSSQRSLSVRPGRYFVRGRGPDILYEGSIDARPGQSRAIELTELRRIEYARLVRKGEQHSRVAHGLELGARMRSPLPSEDRVCYGAFLGYTMDFQHFGARAHLGACASGYDNAVLSASSAAFEADLRAYHAWDLLAFTFELGVGGGVSLLVQRFKTRGDAPPRESTVPFLALGAGVGLDVGAGFGLGLDLAAETHFLRVQSAGDARPRFTAAFAVRPALSFSKRF